MLAILDFAVVASGEEVPPAQLGWYCERKLCTTRLSQGNHQAADPEVNFPGWVGGFGNKAYLSPARAEAKTEYGNKVPCLDYQHSTVQLFSHGHI